jgi:hypothetical protein
VADAQHLPQLIQQTHRLRPGQLAHVTAENLGIQALVVI